LKEIVERARRCFRVVIKRGQLAVTVDAQPQSLPRRSAMSDRTKHLFAAEHQLDRSPDHPGGHDAEHLWSGDQTFGAEATAEERTANVDVLWRDAKEPGDAPLR